VRRELAVPDGTTLILSVGRLTHQKGFDNLVAAAAGFLNESVVFLIAGAGEERPALEDTVRSRGLDGHVRFLGYRRDVPSLLAGTDLFVHPSRYEGMPVAVLEAMAAGCPVVATSVDGTRALIRDGIHGWLVPPEDAEALTAAITSALRDPLERSRRGQAAQERVRREFTEDGMALAWERVLSGR
jgi:glycosyltransferase involved in cell wall biosynthesis